MNGAGRGNVGRSPVALGGQRGQEVQGKSKELVQNEGIRGDRTLSVEDRGVVGRAGEM